MKDPERIDEILGLARRIWKRYPDFRFQQLIYVNQDQEICQDDEENTHLVLLCLLPTIYLENVL